MQVSDEDFKAILQGDRDLFNKILDEVSVKTIEATLRSIPVMIGKLMQVASSTRAMVQKVYDDNPEFKKYKEVVVLTIQEVEAQNAGLTYQEVTDKAIPIIKQKIVEFERISSSVMSSPTVESIEKRLNGAI